MNRTEGGLLMTTFANIQTQLPGPKAKALLDRRHEIVPDAITYGVPTFVESAKGAFRKEVDGNQFTDFAARMGTMNMGHCQREVVGLLRDQWVREIHTGF